MSPALPCAETDMDRKMKEKSGLRLLLICGAALLFSGLLVFSTITVRYSVEGTEKDEFEVLQYSLTESIKRGQGGDFTFTSTSLKEGEPKTTLPGPCDT